MLWYYNEYHIRRRLDIVCMKLNSLYFKVVQKKLSSNFIQKYQSVPVSASLMFQTIFFQDEKICSLEVKVAFPSKSKQEVLGSLA